jgi:hypothetical protein
VAFSDLCVESGASLAGLEAAFTRITHGEAPLERLESDRETIYSRELRIGSVDLVLQAVAAVGQPVLRSCRVTAQLAELEGLETSLERMLAPARRTEPLVQQMGSGATRLLQVSGKWLAPRPGIAAVEMTVEVFLKRRKVTLTAIPALP